MMDFAARRACTLVAGVSGSGKTTFALRYLVHDRSLALRLVWDPDGQLSTRLGVPPATTVQELALAAEDGWIVFDPNVMFPGKHGQGFDWFCRWAYQVAGARPGRKCLLVDEVWRYCTATTIPQSLAECIQTGRVRSLDTLFAVQRPNRLNEAILNEATEFVAFRLQGSNALRTVESLGADGLRVSNLPLGTFESWNLQNGQRLSGRVF